MITKLIARIQGFVLSDDGATAIEYGLIAGGISLGIVAAVFLLGGDLRGVFTAASTSLQGVSTNVNNNAAG
jgi:pilus assembly protein Flp/PilA